MSNSKALKALALIEQEHPEKPKSESFTLTIRLPGDTANRVLALHDWGPTDHAAQPSTDGKHATPNKPLISRNSVVIALIEAGLEAVEAASLSKTKGKK